MPHFENCFFCRFFFFFAFLSCFHSLGWVRVPDLGFVARLGMAADRAISSASPGHLMEMCRVRSPSPTARRLLLALVVALGLR